MTPDVHALTGPYVLNALPDDERHSFERHLADCSSCQAEVAELREAATRLGSAAAAEPPPSLKARVLAAAESTRQLAPVGAPDAGPAGGASNGGPAGGAGPLGGASNGGPVGRRTRSRRSFLALAAAGVAVAGSGGIALDQYRDASKAREHNERIAAILGESDARTAHGPVTGGGRATVVMSVRRDAAVVLLQDLRQPPEGRTYQLWFMDRAENARSLGLSPGGTHQTIVEGVAQVAAFGITIEPTGGSRTPTTPAVTLVGLT
jgi:anti-sigma-K factor RskA